MAGIRHGSRGVGERKWTEAAILLTTQLLGWVVSASTLVTCCTKWSAQNWPLYQTTPSPNTMMVAIRTNLILALWSHKESVWSGGKLPDAWYDEFVFQGFVAGDLEPGGPLYFPVVQECEKGVHRWIEIPAAGKSAADYPEPAPVLRLLPRPAPPPQPPAQDR